MYLVIASGSIYHYLIEENKHTFVKHFEMGTSNANQQKEVEYVLISDEDDDDVPDNKSIKPGSYNSNDIKVVTDEQRANYSVDSDGRDSDGRRVSRRRKNKNDHLDDVKNIDQSRSGRSNGNDHTNDTYKNSPNSSFSNANSDKKYGGSGGGGSESRAETRSRKRERTPSPVPVDAKDNDPIQYKEILSGLEGAAFQSRFVHESFFLH